MKKRVKFVLFASTVHVFLSFYSCNAQNIIENIGFGQPTDSAKEGDSDMVKIRLEPSSIDTDVSGDIIPLSLSQYRDYISRTQRIVPQSVQAAINSIVDPAEYDADNSSGKRDFNNATQAFTLPAGRDSIDINMREIINVDEVNEAEEQFILVLETDLMASDLEFDEDGGILVVTILDDNPIVLHFTVPSYTFSESDGTVEDVLRVQKQDGSPPTEVVIPLKIITSTTGTPAIGGTATIGADGDFEVENITQLCNISIKETEVRLDPITIHDDIFPEGAVTFFLYLSKGENAETLNIFTITTPAMMIIDDDDEAIIGFEKSVYSVTEMEPSTLVEVCINVTNGLSLDHGYGSAIINLITHTGTAADAAGDYISAPTPSTVTIQREQERVCSNIIINDDIFVEATEEFTVSLVTLNTTFSAGVSLMPDNANIYIEDNDGAVVGFAMTNYAGVEGGSVEVCVTILSPNPSVLLMSDFAGEFRINGNNPDTSVPTDPLHLSPTNHEQCSNVTLISDGLIEETEVVTLSLELTHNMFGIKEIQPNTTDVTIMDGDSAMIGFNQSLYTLHEQSEDPTTDVCVQLMDKTIAPGISVSYSLEYDDSGITQVSSISSTSGSLTAETTSVCYSITVTNNDVVELNGTIVVKILSSSLHPPATILRIAEANIIVVNDDSLSVSVEASSTAMGEGTTMTLSVGYSGILHPLSAVGVTVTTLSGSATALDYEVENIAGLEIPLELLPPHLFPIELSSNITRREFTVVAVDDLLLEDDREMFSISISLDDSGVLAEIESDKSLVEITILDNEELRFSFKDPYAEISENSVDEHLLYVMIENSENVTIPPDVSIAISVEVHNMSSNATQDLDYTINRQDLVFQNYTPANGLNVSLSIMTDVLVEGQEVINFTFSEAEISNLNNKNAAVAGSNGYKIVVISDDDELTVGFNTTRHSGVEGDTIDVCVKILDGVLGPGILLDYIINAPRENPELPLGREADSATSDADYSSTGERVPLSAEITGRCVEIRLLEDTIVEIDEFFLVQVEQIISSNDPVFGPNPEYTEITIFDNDEILLGFERAEYAFNESVGSLPESVYIVRENPVTVSSEFNITVLLLSQSTATDTADFSVPGGFNVTVTFSGTDDRQPFPLDILPDMVGEGDETIVLLIITPGDLDGVIPGAINITTITIIEDDFIPYRYTLPGYEFSEVADTSQICLEFVSGKLAPGGYITFNLLTSPVTATAEVDYSSAIIPSSITLSNTARIACSNVTITQDELVEGMEAFDVYYEVDKFMGSYIPDGSDLAMIIIRDSNVAEVGFQLTKYTVVEGEQMIVTVCVAILNGVLTDVVSLNYTITALSQTATEDEDYGTMIVPNGGTLSQVSNSMCHEMVIFDDDSVEPPEMFTVSITATGPTPEFISLFDITLPETTVQIIDNDSLSVGFENATYAVSEDSGAVEVCLMFRGPLKSDSHVELVITLTAGSATSADYTTVPDPATLALDSSHNRGCVSIIITDDNIVEGTEPFEVHFTGTDDNQIIIVGSNIVPVLITDDEVIQLRFGQLTYTFSENTNISMVDIEIGNYDQLQIENTVSVSILSLANATNATENDDYELTLASDPVIISVGRHSAQIMLRVTDDVMVEGVEQVTLMFSNGDVVGIEQDVVNTDGAQTTVFIQDNDDATIGFIKTAHTTAEGIVSACVGLQNGDLQSDAVIRYGIAIIPVTAGVADFEPLMEGEGMIEAASTTFCHNITIVDDDLVEAAEQLEVNLLSVFNVAGVQLSPNTTTITIDDDDTVRVGFQRDEYSVKEEKDMQPLRVMIIREDHLTAVHGFNVSLQLNAASTATEGLDFSITGGTLQMIHFDPLETSKEVNVSSNDDELGEGNELIILELVTDVASNVINVNSEQQTTNITIVENDIIPVSFTNANEPHSVKEGDVIELCIGIVSGIANLPPNGFVDISVSTMPVTAETADYTFEPTLYRGKLNSTVSSSCFTITTINDSIVEGKEEFNVQFAFEENSGSFVIVVGGDNVVITITDDDYFELGFENSVYVIGEESGVSNDTVHIVKLNDNILQMHYDLTVRVLPADDDPYPAELDEDYEFDSFPPLTITFETTHTRLPVSFTLIDDTIEEGYETFTLQLSYNEADEDGTVQIVTESALISIKDDDVVVIGFEKSAYVVFEGERTEVCVAVLDRQLTNDEVRQFSVATTQLTDYAATGGNIDYVDILPTTRSISRNADMRQCFMIITNDDSLEEEPERLEISGTAKSHFLEFNPHSAVIWIIDDESLLLPKPDVTAFNCTSSENDEGTLTVACRSHPGDPPVSPLCSIDCEDLRSCHNVKTIPDANTYIYEFTIDLLEYSTGNHCLEIVGLTQKNEILRDTVKFYGLADPFELTCIDIKSESGLITITCATDRVLESLTCTVDEGKADICALQFVLDPDDYGKGTHTVVVTATSLLGETSEYKVTFGKAFANGLDVAFTVEMIAIPNLQGFATFISPSQVSAESSALSTIVENREFIAAVTVAGVAFVILLLLTIAICLLICYHHRVNKYRYSSEHGYGVERNLSYREHDLAANELAEQQTTESSSDSEDAKSESVKSQCSKKKQPKSSQPQDTHSTSKAMGEEGKSDLIQSVSPQIQPTSQQSQASLSKSLTEEITESSSILVDLSQLHGAPETPCPKVQTFQALYTKPPLSVETNFHDLSQEPVNLPTREQQQQQPSSPPPTPPKPVKRSVTPHQDIPTKNKEVQQPPTSTTTEQMAKNVVAPEPMTKNIQLAYRDEGKADVVGAIKSTHKLTTADSEKQIETKISTQISSEHKTSQVVKERHTERLMSGGVKENHGLKVTYWREKEQQYREKQAKEWKGHLEEMRPAQDGVHDKKIALATSKSASEMLL